jgi:hypothetical protein
MDDITIDLVLARAEIATLKADLAALTARAAKAEQERDRAIEDINSMALAMRESEELSVGCCFACIYENLPEDCILPYGECPGYERDDCFEWRGLPPKGE